MDLAQEMNEWPARLHGRPAYQVSNASPPIDHHVWSTCPTTLQSRSRQRALTCLDIYKTAQYSQDACDSANRALSPCPTPAVTPEPKLTPKRRLGGFGSGWDDETTEERSPKFIRQEGFATPTTRFPVTPSVKRMRRSLDEETKNFLDSVAHAINLEFEEAQRSNNNQSEATADNDTEAERENLKPALATNPPEASRFSVHERNREWRRYHLDFLARIKKAPQDFERMDNPISMMAVTDLVSLAHALFPAARDFLEVSHNRDFAWSSSPETLLGYSTMWEAREAAENLVKLMGRLEAIHMFGSRAERNHAVGWMTGRNFDGSEHKYFAV